jgi:AraC-like DNA-binding protein
MMLSPLGVSDCVGESLDRTAVLRDTRTSTLIAYSSKAWSRGIEAAGLRAYGQRPMSSQINDLAPDPMHELRELTARFSDGDGIHPTAVPGLHCIQLSAPHMQLPSVYNPCVCVIVQGTKQVLLEHEIYRYAPPQFLAVSVDLPLSGQVIEASAEKPYLCLAIDLDVRQIADLIAHSGDAAWSKDATGRGLFIGEVDGPMRDSVLRLARLLGTPQDIPVLAPMAIREFHYRLLSGPYGATIAQLAIAGSNTHKIGQIIRRIKSQLASPIRVDELASLANMSPSSFHQHFKAVTAMSPVQYQKKLRLTEARQLLLARRADASGAAYRVGYQSVSQFSREYARMFGAPPRRDVDAIRANAG